MRKLAYTNDNVKKKCLTVLHSFYKVALIQAYVWKQGSGDKMTKS